MKTLRAWRAHYTLAPPRDTDSLAQQVLNEMREVDCNVDTAISVTLARVREHDPYGHVLDQLRQMSRRFLVDVDLFIVPNTPPAAHAEVKKAARETATWRGVLSSDFAQTSQYPEYVLWRDMVRRADAEVAHKGAALVNVTPNGLPRSRVTQIAATLDKVISVVAHRTQLLEAQRVRNVEVAKSAADLSSCIDHPLEVIHHALTELADDVTTYDEWDRHPILPPTEPTKPGNVEAFTAFVQLVNTCGTNRSAFLMRLNEMADELGETMKSDLAALGMKGPEGSGPADLSDVESFTGEIEWQRVWYWRWSQRTVAAIQQLLSNDDVVEFTGPAAVDAGTGERAQVAMPQRIEKEVRGLCTYLSKLRTELQKHISYLNREQGSGMADLEDERRRDALHFRNLARRVDDNRACKITFTALFNSMTSNGNNASAPLDKAYVLEHTASYLDKKWSVCPTETEAKVVLCMRNLFDQTISAAMNHPSYRFARDLRAHIDKAVTLIQELLASARRDLQQLVREMDTAPSLPPLVLPQELVLQVVWPDAPEWALAKSVHNASLLSLLESELRCEWNTPANGRPVVVTTEPSTSASTSTSTSASIPPLTPSTQQQQQLIPRHAASDVCEESKEQDRDGEEEGSQRASKVARRWAPTHARARNPSQGAAGRTRPPLGKQQHQGPLSRVSVSSASTAAASPA